LDFWYETKPSGNPAQDYNPPSSPSTCPRPSAASQTRRAAKKTPAGDEITDDYLRTLISAAKFYVPVNVIGVEAPQKPGVNPTIANATGSLARFENKNIIFYF
jgi:hypothetical protein